MTIENTPQAWSDRAVTARTSHEAALWSEKGQRDRMVAVIKALDPQPGERLLDFGCGTGRLVEFLPDGVGYMGHDWSLGMLTRAKVDHPGHQWTASQPMGKFDLVACIGTFNLKHNWSKEKTWMMLLRCWILNRPRALVACLYRGEDRACLRYEPVETLAAVRNLDALSTVSEYLPNDLLLVMKR